MRGELSWLTSCSAEEFCVRLPLPRAPVDMAPRIYARVSRSAPTVDDTSILPGIIIGDRIHYPGGGQGMIIGDHIHSLGR